jgi:hypothetical protein
LIDVIEATKSKTSAAMLTIRQGLYVFCFQQLGANFVYQVVQDARRKYDEEQQ